MSVSVGSICALPAPAPAVRLQRTFSVQVGSAILVWLRGATLITGTEAVGDHGGERHGARLHLDPYAEAQPPPRRLDRVTDGDQKGGAAGGGLGELDPADLHPGRRVDHLQRLV